MVERLVVFAKKSQTDPFGDCLEPETMSLPENTEGFFQVIEGRRKKLQEELGMKVALRAIMTTQGKPVFANDDADCDLS